MKQSQSILFLTRLYHPHIGGVEKHVMEISSELIKKGYKVEIVTEQFDANLPTQQTLNGVRVYRIPVTTNERIKKFLIWRWVLTHPKLFIRADIVHIHDVFYWVFPLRLFMNGKKIFMTFHGYEGYPIKKTWKIQRKIAEKLTNGNICVGDFMKKWYLTSPTSVIYGGVRLESNKYKPLVQSAVFFGRLDSQTGVEQYIDAYKKVKLIFPKFKFTLVGEGKILRKVPKDIKVKGFTSEVSKYIGKNRFIFVSRYLSMLEALSQKREVVAVYDNQVKKDYLIMSPFREYITVCENSDQIAEHIIKRLINSSVDKKTLDGYIWAKKQTWERIVSVYQNLWK